MRIKPKGQSRRNRRFYAAAAAELLESRELLSVSSELVADLVQHGNRGSNIQQVTFGSEFAYFTADTDSTGNELWKSDGTSIGTSLVRDIIPGPESSGVSQVTTVGQSVYFSASQWTLTSYLSRETFLWRSDGTAEGTEPVKWANGSRVVSPGGLVSLDGSLCFWAATVEGAAWSLFKLEDRIDAVPIAVAIPGSTQAAFDIPGLSTPDVAFFFLGGSGNPEIVALRSGQPAGEVLGRWTQTWFPQTVGNRLTFYASVNGQIEHWVSDGTRVGTVALPLPAQTSLNALTEMNDGRFMFIGQNGFIGQDGFPNRVRDLWISDGTSSGTVKQFQLPGLGPYYPRPTDRIAASLSGGRIAFLVDGEIWQTDGTEVGTVRLTNYDTLQPRLYELIPFGDVVLFIASDMTSVDTRPRWYKAGGDLPLPVDLGPVDPTLEIDWRMRFFSGSGHVLMSAFAQGIDEELWGIEGAGPFRLLRDINPANGSSFPNSLTQSASRIFFNASTLSGFFESDGAEQTRSLPDFQYGREIVPTESEAVFIFTDSEEIYVRLTNLDTWKSLRTLAPGATFRSPRVVAVLGDRVYFQGTGVSGDRQLWVTDGTSAGTSAIRDSQGVVTNSLDAVALDDTRMIFRRTEPSELHSLWITDGTVNGIREILPATQFTSSFLSDLHKTANGVIFTIGGSHLGTTDGTAEGTRIILDLSPDFINIIASSETTTFFLRYESGGQKPEIWQTDGTSVGTRMIARMPEPLETQPVAVDDVLYFTCANSLWAAGGATAQLRKLLDIVVTGGPYARNTLLFSEFGKLFFLTDSNDYGRTLWTSDGTVSGTHVLLTADGTVPDYVWSELMGFKGEIYYSGVTDEHGVELMRLSSDTVDGVPGLLRLETGAVPALRWREVFGAASYDLQVVNLASGSASVATFAVAEDHWEIPESLRDSALRVWVRGVGPDGSKGGWNRQPFDFTLDHVPVIHSVPSMTTTVLPILAWAAPIGTTRTEIWINDLDLKQRVLLETIEGSKSTFKCPVLAPSQYVFWVRTHGQGGTSEWSQAAVFTVLAPAPQLLTVNADASRRITIDWSPVEGATDYEILIFRKGAAEPYLRKSQIGPRTSWTLPASSPGDEYTVWVRARRPGRIHSAWSEARTLLVRQAPIFHVSLPEIHWEPVGQAIAYEIVVTNVRSGERITARSLTNSFRLEPQPVPGLYEVQLRSLYGDGSVSEWAVQRQELFHAKVVIETRSLSTVDATPVIRWTRQSGAAGYEVVVTAQGSLAAIYRATVTAVSQHRIANALPVGVYRIWIRSHHSDGGRSVWGTGTDLTIGTAPVLSVSGTMLHWNAIDGATRYEVIVHVIDPRSSVASTYLRSTVYGSTQLTLPSGSNGRFRAWVRAIRDEAGTQYVSRWSNQLNFTI